MSAVPRDALIGALAMLDAVSLSRCRRVCMEWRDASSNERLWRRHCRRVCRLNMDRDLFDKTRAQAKALRSWRLAFPRVPQVHSTGIYVLRGGYFRQPYRDAWHDPPPFLHCIYHRVLALRPDGSLLYGNIPGPVADAVKRIRRVAAFTTAARATNPAVVAAALLDDSEGEASAAGDARGAASARKKRAQLKTVQDISRAQQAAAVNSGRYCLDGSTLRAEVWAEKGRILRWQLRLANSAEEDDDHERGSTTSSRPPAAAAAAAAAASTATPTRQSSGAGAGAGAGADSNAAAFTGLFDRLVVSRMVMAFSPGTTAEDAMHAALAADEAESSDDDSDAPPDDAKAPRTASRSRGFRWPESDESDIQIDSLCGLRFEFLPVDGL